jgi:hypothetical protein
MSSTTFDEKEKLMALILDLNKSAQSLKLSLEKAGIIKPPEAEVAFDLDVSGSFEDEHRDGLTTGILGRLVPWCMVFDPDKKLDLFTFSDGPEHAHYVGEVTTGNYHDYIARNVIEKVPGWNRGTDYAYVLEKNLVHFGWCPEAGAQPQKSSGGLFGGLLGKKKAELAVATPTQKRRSLVLFITDGENNRSDHNRTTQVLADMEARGDMVYVMFVGMSNQCCNFEYLKYVADKFSNTGLYVCHDIQGFLKMSDEAINEALITDELVAWLKK